MKTTKPEGTQFKVVRRGSRSEGREGLAPLKSWGLAFTCDTSCDALCLSQENKNQHFDNVQKASTPISKINGKTSQSRLSPGQHLPGTQLRSLGLSPSASTRFPPSVLPLQEGALPGENCQQIGK